MPGWDGSMLETRREEYRRLVWAVLVLGTANIAHATSTNRQPLSLDIHKYWKVRAHTISYYFGILNTIYYP